MRTKEEVDLLTKETIRTIQQLINIQDSIGPEEASTQASLYFVSAFEFLFTYHPHQLKYLMDKANKDWMEEFAPPNN